KPITRAPEVAFQTLSWDNQFVDVVLVIHGDTSGGPRLGAVEFNLNRGSFRSLENRPCVDKRAQHVCYVVALPVDRVPGGLNVGCPLLRERSGIAVDICLARPPTLERFAVRK